MAIKEVDGWSVGEAPDDLMEYATTQGAVGYDVHQIRLCKCAACGGEVFGLLGDQEENAAKRVCRGCAAEHFIADSGDYWDGTDAGVMVCESCDEEDFNVAVGFSLYSGDAGVRALAVTSRCVACGQLGYWDDWMIRGGGMDLLDLA